MAILASYAIIRFVAEPLVNRAKTALPPNKPLETAK
jgi:hypothetical protein